MVSHHETDWMKSVYSCAKFVSCLCEFYRHQPFATLLHYTRKNYKCGSGTVSKRSLIVRSGSLQVIGGDERGDEKVEEKLVEKVEEPGYNTGL